MRLRHARLAVSWLAALAILLGAVTPSLAAWLGPAGETTWLEVCTSTGIQRIAQDNDTPETPLDAHAGSHCLYCLLQQEHPAIAQAHAQWRPHTATQSTSPPPVTLPPRTESHWTAHQSRAPPLHA